MKKRIMLLLLAACLMLNLLPMGALAEEAEETTETVEETTEAVEETEEEKNSNAKSGSCGDGLTWTFEDRTLYISGSGEMADGDPWSAHKNRIKRVVLSDGVTKVGAECFYEYGFLESVNFGDALVEIGERAFYGCTELTVIHLPKTFRTFGAECFRDCIMLQKVYCDGGMPRFNSSCLWNGNYVQVFYPTNNVWPQDAVSQLVSNFGGRLGVTAGNYDSSIEAELEEKEFGEETTPKVTDAPTEAPTEAVTEPPVEETQAAEVIYITVPPTEETESVTELQTQPSEAETIPLWTMAAEEPEEPEDLSGKSWIGIVMIAGVITFLLAGTMIFRGATKKGGRYKR